MGPFQAKAVALCIALVVLLAAAPTAWAQEQLSARLDPSGLIRLMRGDVEVAEIELNAHGPEWTHAPQATGKAQVSDLPEGEGKRCVGTLPVPKTDGGAVTFTECVRTAPQGLALEYDVGMSKDMKLNGLQVSVLLPVPQYAGKQLTIIHPEAEEPETVTLPEEQQGEQFQVWGGEGVRIEVARDTPETFALELRAPADIVVQDLRRWEHQLFEIRFPAIMEEPGRDVTTEDRLHLDLIVALPQPVKIEGP